MAEIYPDLRNSDGAPRMRNEAEERVLKKILEQFSDEWTVLTNLDYTRDVSRPQPYVCGEIDFLLRHEIFGVLAIEVKSGVFRSHGGEWLQNGRARERSPWAQVGQEAGFVRDYLRHELGFRENERLPFPVVGVPCFPDCAWNDSLPPNVRGKAIWADDLDNLPAVVENFLRNARSREDARRRCDGLLVELALRGLVEIAERLRDHSTEERAALLRLTEEQGRVLNAAARGQARFRVRGGAGTGKSVIALEKAKRLAAAGRNVLLLCYNLLLCENFRKSARGCPNVSVRAFSVFARERLGISDAERDAVPPERRNAFFEELPRRLLENLRETPLKFDAVIVDEAQDFSPDMWLAVEEMTKPEGDFVIFYDPNQNIFRDELALPSSLAGAPEYVLSRNCRNTRAIFDAVRARFADGTELPAGTPDGEAVHEYFPATPQECRAVLAETLGSLRTRGVPACDVTIIGPRARPEDTAVGADADVGGFRVVSPPLRRFESGTIEYFTCMRFKGCETGTLILFELDENSPDWNPRRLYAAISRAVNRLVIIHAPPAKAG
ncbi:MAG: NERD domain-containing protein [Candidatus Spyradosoma sp.]